MDSILIDLYQQGRINEARNKAEDAAGRAKLVQGDLENLERRLDALVITCQALWEIIRTQTGLSDHAILEKMEEIDGRDGRVDGKISAGLSICPSCNRRSNAHRTTCLYCGAALPVKEVFNRR